MDTRRSGKAGAGTGSGDVAAEAPSRSTAVVCSSQRWGHRDSRLQRAGTCGLIWPKQSGHLRRGSGAPSQPPPRSMDTGKMFHPQGHIGPQPGQGRCLARGAGGPENKAGRVDVSDQRSGKGKVTHVAFRSCCWNGWILVQISGCQSAFQKNLSRHCPKVLVSWPFTCDEFSGKAKSKASMARKLSS